VDTPLLAQASPGRKSCGSRAASRAKVLDDIERCLERGRFWVFAGWQPRLGWWLRCWRPGSCAGSTIDWKASDALCAIRRTGARVGMDGHRSSQI
jgi:hypothetical protein